MMILMLRVSQSCIFQASAVNQCSQEIDVLGRGRVDRIAWIPVHPRRVVYNFRSTLSYRNISCPPSLNIPLHLRGRVAFGAE